MDITDWGKLAANPAARVDAAARMLKCECTETKACQDLGTQTLADSVTVTDFVYEGVTYTLDTALLVTNVEGIAAAFNAVIEQFEVEPIINVKYEGGDLIVEHWGAGTLSSVVTSGTNVTMARECETEIVCKYSFSISETFTLNGESITISGSSTPTSVATAVEGELQGVGFKGVAVTEDPDETFNIVVSAIRGFAITVNGDEVVGLSCIKGWKTADDLGE